MARYARWRIRLLATWLVVLSGIIHENGWAQVDPSILQQPWLKLPHWAETYDDLFITDLGHTKQGDLDTGIFWWDSTGRIKVHRDDAQPKFVIGYTMLANGINSEDPRLNGTTWDIGVVVGAPLGKICDDWEVSALGGVGTANDGHWTSETLYGIGAVDFAHKLDENQTLNVGLYYNGNSPLFPDIPMPYISYGHVVSEKLSYVIGAPRSSILYHPFEPLTLEFRYSYPVDLSTRAEFKLIEPVRLFVMYAQNTDAVHQDGTEHQRQFYKVQRVQGGVRWITKWFDASFGVGYTLDHEFRSGFDIRDTSKVADISEEPFVALIVQGTF